MRQDQGMYAEDIRRGVLVDGMRVVGLSPARVDGRSVIAVRLDDGTRRGARRVYPAGVRVPGTRRRTSTDMPAGPVPAGPRPMLLGKVGRGEDESAGDYRARRMASVVYG